MDLDPQRVISRTTHPRARNPEKNHRAQNTNLRKRRFQKQISDQDQSQDR